MQKYLIKWVGWNSAHPFEKTLGVVWATCEAAARMKAREKWPCGSGQIYEAHAL